MRDLGHTKDLIMEDRQVHLNPLAKGSGGRGSDQIPRLDMLIAESRIIIYLGEGNL